MSGLLRELQWEAKLGNFLDLKKQKGCLFCLSIVTKYCKYFNERRHKLKTTNWESNDTPTSVNICQHKIYALFHYYYNIVYICK